MSSRATLHDTEPQKLHSDDKILHCCRCKKWIHIPFNHVGGAWHLGGWVAPDGSKHWGTYCNPCFDDLHKLGAENHESKCT